VEKQQEQQLSMDGWIRISSDILPPHFAVERPKDAINASTTGWLSPVYEIYKSSTHYSSFLVSRFLGNQSRYLEEEKELPRPYQDFYGVLKHKTLFLYVDETKKQFIKAIMVPHYSISLTPESLTDHELFMPHNPIILHVLPDCNDLPIDPLLCLYPPTASEKENWFVILKRACSLPPFADAEAIAAFHQESAPMRKYTEAMKKLVAMTTSSGMEDGDLSATAWLNALVGRMFVTIHANKNVKNWVMQRLSRHTVDSEDDDSFLGAIAIQDIDVGDSLPVLSNPKLVKISVDGDMLIEMDIDYTGGVRIEAATCATLSVPAWVLFIN
jgi:hypothetical protein